MDEPLQSGGSVYWGETGIPPQNIPKVVGNVLVVAPGELKIGNTGCIWDFMQLMGQCGAGEGPCNFIVFSTKKPQFYPFYFPPLFFNTLAPTSVIALRGTLSSLLPFIPCPGFWHPVCCHEQFSPTVHLSPAGSPCAPLLPGLLLCLCLPKYRFAEGKINA